jgi:hypothetical protein
MRVPFSSLPDDARIWIFASSAPLDPAAQRTLLDEVDAYLDDWRAHGEPLTCAREWRDERFLVIGVDQTAAGASGCSIDALFHILQRLQASLGVDLVGGGRVFWRDAGGSIHCAARADFARQGAEGSIDALTRVFDHTLTRAADYRAGFERDAQSSWHATLIS